VATISLLVCRYRRNIRRTSEKFWKELRVGQRPRTATPSGTSRAVTHSDRSFKSGTATFAGCFAASVPAFKFVLIFIALAPQGLLTAKRKSAKTCQPSSLLNGLKVAFTRTHFQIRLGLNSSVLARGRGRCAESISFVKKTAAESAPIGCKINQIQHDIDEVAPHGAPHVIAHAPRTSRLIRVRRSSVLEGLQTL
jgi:hypothetical protein